MQYKNFPQLDIKVSAIALGTWVFGGELWGGSEEKDCIAAVHTALDLGVNLIDTAPIYGRGKAEEIVGRAIKGKRNKVILATKCGLVNEGKRVINNLSAQSIQKEIETSLKRLQTDYIDLYQCHWPDLNTPLEETMSTLNELKQKGKIRYVGVSNFDQKLLEKSLAMAPVMTLQSQFSLLQRSIEKGLMPFCQKEKIGILGYGALGGGILTGKYHASTHFRPNDARGFFYQYYKGEEFNKTALLLNKLKKIGKPLNQVALNWVRQHPAITTALVGCRNSQQVQDNVQAVTWDLTEEEFLNIGMEDW